MTAVNHVMTGAVIALAVKQPELAVVLAFISHYVCDVIPHFGIYEDNVLRRNASMFFRIVLGISLVGMIVALILIPNIAAGKVSALTIFVCMAVAILPDAAWVPQFFHEVRTKKTRLAGKYSAWHQKIQWFEQPIGLIIEGCWLVAMSGLIWGLK